MRCGGRLVAGDVRRLPSATRNEPAGWRRWAHSVEQLGDPMKWTTVLICVLAIACGGEDDSKPTGTAGASDSAETCIDADTCCKVCDESQPCGDSCIAADLECSTAPGCACDISVVCVEDSGEEQ